MFVGTAMVDLKNDRHGASSRRETGSSSIDRLGIEGNCVELLELSELCMITVTGRTIDWLVKTVYATYLCAPCIYVRFKVAQKNVIICSEFYKS